MDYDSMVDGGSIDDIDYRDFDCQINEERKTIKELPPLIIENLNNDVGINKEFMNENINHPDFFSGKGLDSYMQCQTRLYEKFGCANALKSKNLEEFANNVKYKSNSGKYSLSPDINVSNLFFVYVQKYKLSDDAVSDLLQLIKSLKHWINYLPKTFRSVKKQANATMPIYHIRTTNIDFP